MRPHRYPVSFAKKRTTCTTEHDHCEAFVHWLALHSKEIPSFARVFHIANEGVRTYSFANRLKRIGWRAGFADYIWIVGPGGRCVFFEFKSEKGRQTDSQKAFADVCTDATAQYVLVHHWTEAAKFMLLLLGGERRITSNMFHRLLEQLI